MELEAGDAGADIHRPVAFYHFERDELAGGTPAAGLHVTAVIFERHLYILLVVTGKQPGREGLSPGTRYYSIIFREHLNRRIPG